MVNLVAWIENLQITDMWTEKGLVGPIYPKWSQLPLMKKNSVLTWETISIEYKSWKNAYYTPIDKSFVTLQIFSSCSFVEKKLLQYGLVKKYSTSFNFVIINMEKKSRLWKTFFELMSIPKVFTHRVGNPAIWVILFQLA